MFIDRCLWGSHFELAMQVRPGRGEFHENPAACICERPEAKEKLRVWREQQAKKPKKPQEATEIKAQGPVIPLEDRIDAEAEEDEDEVPLVIEDDQPSDEIADGTRDTEELLLETESHESAGDGADDDEDGDNY